MNKNAYQKLLLCAKNSRKETTELSMKTAANEVRNLVISEKKDRKEKKKKKKKRRKKNANIDPDDSHSDEDSIIAYNEFITDTVASSDGSWQKRGYNSLNGAVTIIQNDVSKCIDFRVLSKKGIACTSWEKQQGTLEYEKFISEHNSPINQSGSAGSMEASGVECSSHQFKIESCDIPN